MHAADDEVRAGPEDDTGLSPEAVLVRNALRRAGLENPVRARPLPADECRAVIERHMTAIMQALGLDLDDDSLARTPGRVARMYVDEVFSGLDYHNFPAVSVFENKMHCDEMIKISNITVTSMCEHHFVVMDGQAKVAYMPAGHIIGISKINRIVQFFAHRPQLQERLAQQILVALQTLLKTRNVAVTITATHYCVKSRGARDQTSVTTTTSLGGLFKRNPSSRHEFLTD